MSSLPPQGGAVSPAGPVSVCPRHPDRESYVRCQRCERPVCPECQRTAAVGVQCVDCVRAQAKAAPVARTIFGGRPGAGAAVTQALIGLCVTVFVLQLVGGRSVTDQFDFIPTLATAEPWRFLTSAFLHLTSFPLHILFNMYALWIVGPYLEGLLGRLRFVALYLLSAVGGSVGYFLLAPATWRSAAWGTAVLGASGAVFGLFAALLVVNRRLGRDTAGILGVIVINGALGFIIHGIAWQAHLGGLLTGAAIAVVFAHTPKQRRNELQAVGLGTVAAVLVLLVMVKVALVPAGLLA